MFRWKLISKNFIHILPNLEIKDREKFIISKCSGKRVLNLGAIDFYENQICGLHKKLMAVSKDVIGIDIDEKGIKIAEKAGFKNIYYGDVENLNKTYFDFKYDFDVIIAGEIIEHLSNPGRFLEGIKQFLGKSEMIITTPNALNLHHFIFALIGIEYIHPDHVQIYSYHTLRRLLENHNFKVKNVYYYILSERERTLSNIIFKIFPKLATGLIFVVTYDSIKR